MKLSSIGLGLCLFALALSGCGGGGGGNSQPNDGIPNQLNFTPQKGDSLSDQDKTNLKTYMQTNKADAPSNHLIKINTASNQPTSGTSVGQAPRTSSVPAEYNIYLNGMANKCNISQPAVTQSSPFDPNNGQNTGFFVFASAISGANCPETYSMNGRLDMSLIAHSSDEGSMKMVLTMNQSETINDPDLQKLSNTLSSALNINGTMFVHAYKNAQTRAYLNFHFSDDVISATPGAQKMTWSGSMEFLGTSTSQNTGTGMAVLQLRVDGFSKTIFISAVANGSMSTDPNSMKFTYYVNGEQVSDPALIALLQPGMPMAQNQATLSTMSLF